jgi:hypothetical protein
MKDFQKKYIKMQFVEIKEVDESHECDELEEDCEC